jgi:hypothetical protein
MENRNYYEAEYDNRGIQVGVFNAPKLAKNKKDVIRVKITRDPDPLIDLYFTEEEAMDVAIGIFYSIRNLKNEDHEKLLSSGGETPEGD